MTDNLFAKLTTEPASEEIFTTLLQRSGLRIERIVSTGQCSPPDFWYDQAEEEWVVLLAGEARLRFADEDEDRRLQAGDWLDIAAHRKHRVTWTSTTPAAVWLAVFHAAPLATDKP